MRRARRKKKKTQVHKTEKSARTLHNEFHLSSKSLRDPTHIISINPCSNPASFGNMNSADKESNRVKCLDQGHPTIRSRTGCKHPPT